MTETPQIHDSVGNNRRRRLRGYIITAAVVLVGIHFVLPDLAGLDRTITVLKDADPWWLGVAVLMSATCLGCYIGVFHHVVADGAGAPFGKVHLGWRESYQTAMASLGASTVITAGGAGGIGLMLWLLSRAGLSRTQAVARVVAFLAFHYSIFLSAIFLFGMGLWLGLLPGESPTALTLVPALIAAGLLILLAVVASRPGGVESRFSELSGGASRWSRLAGRLVSIPSAIASGIRFAASLLRPWRQGLLIVALAAGYWATNVAILAACFEAFGARPPVAVLVQALLVGMVANLLPLLPGGVGSVEAALIGTLLAFGAPGPQVVVSVLAYRFISFWLPTVFEAIAYFQLRKTVGHWLDDEPRSLTG